MRGRVSKIAMFMLVLCMTASLLISGAEVQAEELAIADACSSYVIDKYDVTEVAENYMNKNVAPTCKTEGDYLFAGWYTDETCTTSPVEDGKEPTEGTVYAKFAPSHVLGVRAQVSVNLLDGKADNDDKANLRFVTSADTLKYVQIGFEVTFNGKTQISSSSKVYRQLLGSDGDGNTIWKYKPENTFCALSYYFKACTVTGIPEANYDDYFQIKPFWVTVDGTKVYGEEASKRVRDGILNQTDVYISTTGDDENGDGTKEKPYATLEHALNKVQAENGTIYVIGNYTVKDTFVWETHAKSVIIKGADSAADSISFANLTELHINDMVKFESITLNTPATVYAEGHALTIASDVTFSSSSAPIIYGGSDTAVVKGTELNLYAGTYASIYGGGNGKNVEGNINVTVGGSVNSTYTDWKNHSGSYNIYGGSNGATVNGNITITVESGNFNYIYGGGNSGAVNGDCKVTFNGNAMNVSGGSYSAKVTGDTFVVMEGGYVEQIFGGCQYASMTGNTSVHVLGGEVARRVYGGCYNEFKTNGLTSGTWQSNHYVTGYTTVTVKSADLITRTYREDYTEKDNSLYATSRLSNTVVPLEENGVFVFMNNTYSDYESDIGYHTSLNLFQSYYSTKTHNTLVKATTGGEVYAEGDVIRIKPNPGNKAVVTLDGVEVHYTEGESTYALPAITSATETHEIIVTFDPNPTTTADYEACTNGVAYYLSLEDAVKAINTTEKTLIEILKTGVVIDATIKIDDDEDVTIKGDEGLDVDINRDNGFGSMFTVSEGSSLTLEGVTLDGRTSEEISNNVTSLDELSGSEYSLISNTGNVTLRNVTAQYAVKTKAHGAVLQSGGDTDVVTVEGSTFSYNKAPGQGAAIRMGGSTVKLDVSDSSFEYNHVYYDADTNTANGGAIGTHADTADITNCKFVGNTATGQAADEETGVEQVNASSGAIYSGTSSVVTITGTNENALFEGNQVFIGNGGAISLGSGEITITGYTFESNKSSGNGGAIWARVGAVTANDCIFGGSEDKANTAGGNGGVAYAGENASLTFGVDEECDVTPLMSYNKATGNGGAVAIGGADLTVDGYELAYNTANNAGAIQINNNAIETLIKNSTFTSNTATNHGGAIQNQGTNQTHDIDNSTFTSNDAGKSGGAIYNNKGYLDITDTSFTSNTSADLGAGINNSGTLTLEGTAEGVKNGKAIFKDNHFDVTTKINGGAIYNGGSLTATAYTFTENIATQNGGAVCHYGSKLEANDCQFIGNQGLNGGAIYSGGGTTINLKVSTETKPVQTALFDGNISTTRGGAINVGYGYMYIDGYTFQNNTSGYAGAIYFQGELASGAVADGKIENSTFTNNYTNKESGTSGGAIQAGGQLDIIDTSFINNSARTEGGAIYKEDGIFNIRSTKGAVFTQNSSGSDKVGGAIRASSGILNVSGYTFTLNEAGSQGGAIYISGGELNVDTTTFGGKTEQKDEDGNVVTTDEGEVVYTSLGNKATSGGAIYGGGNPTIKLNGTLQASEVMEWNQATRTNTLGGGAICIGTGILEVRGYKFVDNETEFSGGAIHHNQYSYTPEGGEATYRTLIVDNSEFKGNTAADNGGAIYSMAKDTNINGSKFNNNTAAIYGGAIHVPSGKTATIETTSFTGNQAPIGGAINCDNGTLKATSCHFTSNVSTTDVSDADVLATALTGRGGGAVNVVNNGKATFDGTGTFTTNTATNGYGGAIYTTDAELEISGYTFTRNNATQGGAIKIDKVSVITAEDDPDTEEVEATEYDELCATLIEIKDTSFVENYSTSLGGAIDLESRTLKLSKTKAEAEAIFDGNYSSNNAGGAINSMSSGVLTVSNYTFIKNHAKGQGGAIRSHGKSATFSNCTFGGTKEDENGEIVSLGNISEDNGGVYYGGSGCTTEFNIEGTAFNEAKFEANEARGTGYAGGAIAMGSGNLTVKNYSFIGNKATNHRGGAIYHNATGAKINIQNAIFDGNYAKTNGGAIYTIANCTVSESKFINNEAESQGGAIYQSGRTLNISTTTFGGFTEKLDANGDIVKDDDGNPIMVSIGNTAKQGGAIYGGSTPTIKLNGTLNDKEVIAGNSVTGAFEFGGGAICVGSGSLEVAGYVFNGNSSGTTGGAIHHNDDNAGNGGGVFTVTNSKFEGNNAKAYGGAIWSQSPTTTISTSEFTGNSSTNEGGGAIFSEKALTVENNSKFKLNHAVNGGAIYVPKNVEATVKASGFEQNSSDTYGGAIYVDVAKLKAETTTFNLNTSTYGGAITVGTMSTSDVDTGETDDEGNAIKETVTTYNAGTLDIDNCDFTSNSSDEGGAIYQICGTIDLSSTTGSSFDGNKSNVGHGGAIYLNANNEAAVDEEGNVIYDVIISGYTFANNKAGAGEEPTRGNGGAIHIEGNTTEVKIIQSVFNANEAYRRGGAISNESTKLYIEDTKFTGNWGDWSGAIDNAIHDEATGSWVANSESVVTITATAKDDNKAIFSGNYGWRGGAIHSNGGTLNISNYTFKENVATLKTNAESGSYGGAIYNENAVTLNIDNSVFTSNRAPIANGGAICQNNGGTVKITNSEFASNVTIGSGGAYGQWGGGTADIQNTTFTCNQATNQGGAIYANGMTSGTGLQVKDCTFGGTGTSENPYALGNVAKDGGAIYGAGGSLVTVTSTNANARFEGNKSTANYGGGAICIGTGNLTVDGYTFKDNTAAAAEENGGGAIHFRGTTLTFQNTVTFNSNDTTSTKTHGGAVYMNGGTLNANTGKTIFTENSAVTYGGAVYLKAAVTINVKGAEFTNNKALTAAAICNFGTSNLTEVVFSGNKADESGTSGEGGALWTNKTANITDCKFDGNTAAKNGGAIVMAGGTVTLTNNTTTANVDAIFQGNKATSNVGGAIYANKGALTVKGYNFTSNNSKGYGGAVYMDTSATADFSENGAFTSNVSSSYGGAIYSRATAENALKVNNYTFTGNKGTFGGAVMLYQAAAQATVSNSTFDQNEATSNEGGAVYINNSGAAITLTNCIFTNNKAPGSGGAITIGSGTVTLNTADGFTGALFQNNSTSGIGGAIYLANGTLNGSGYTFNNNTPQDVYKKNGTNNLKGTYTTNQ